MQEVRQLAASMAKGSASAESLAVACLDRVAASSSGGEIWPQILPEVIVDEARAADSLRVSGRPLGKLHGIPVAIGASLRATETNATGDSTGVRRGATVVAKLREAGAVPFSGTAAGRAGLGLHTKAHNPHAPSRFLGSGTAAAVAAGHVPVGVEAAWTGDLLHAGSECGIFSLIPSRGCASRHGAVPVTRTLDRIGVFATSLADAACLADAICGYDAADESTHTRPKPRFLDGVLAQVPAEPNFAVLKGSQPSPASMGDNEEAFGELLDALGSRVETIEVPHSFAFIAPHRDVVRLYELRSALQGAAGMPVAYLEEIARALTAQDRYPDPKEYESSIAVIEPVSAFFSDLFNEFDGVLTPAPQAASSSEMTRAATELCGLPSLSLPLLEEADGLPLGVALVAGPDEDARLCRTASWLQRFLQAL